VAKRSGRVIQCQRPSGWLGRLIVWNMNSRHSKLTDWGLSHVDVRPQDQVLDVGCGGGRTVSKLATLASDGKVMGIDFSDVSVSVARKLNACRIEEGQVDILAGSVSELPFPADTFDLVTAVETHFWWPDILGGMREILRVMKPGGTLILIAEIYKGAQSAVARMVEKHAPRSGIKVLSPDEHRALFEDAGYTGVRIVTDPERGWICGVGQKPLD